MVSSSISGSTADTAQACHPSVVPPWAIAPTNATLALDALCILAFVVCLHVVVAGHDLRQERYGRWSPPALMSGGKDSACLDKLATESGMLALTDAEIRVHTAIFVHPILLRPLVLCLHSCMHACT